MEKGLPAEAVKQSKEVELMAGTKIPTNIDRANSLNLPKLK
jgi:hypothetical protein